VPYDRRKLRGMYIYIQPLGKEWRPGSRIIPMELPDQARFHLRRFSEFMAVEMASLLQEAIDRQRYAYIWEPLSIEYYEYKKRNYLSLNIWEATGVLKDNIAAFRRGNTYMVGIHPERMYPGTLVPVHRVARWMEYGTKKMPARPLFRPITYFMGKHIRYYWDMYAIETGAGFV